MADYDKEKQPLKDQGTEGGRGERVEMKFIQGFRFVAMGWIIIYHYIQCCPEEYEVLWPVRLMRGRPLDLFTVVSGFVTHIAYGHRESIGGPFHFLFRRSAKVIFMYGFTLLIQYALHVIHWIIQGRDFLQFLRYFLCNFVPALFGLNVWFSILLPFKVGSDGHGSQSEDPMDAESWLHTITRSCFPVNGALWYIQALAFCWFSYPLCRKLLVPGPGGSKIQKHCIIFLLWFFSILPAMLAQLLSEEERNQELRLWVFLKVFPPFMLPSFYLGVAVCDLYQQETEEAEREERPPGWHESATFFGEILFLFVMLFIAAVHTDALLRFHFYCLAFGLVVFYFAVSSATSAQQTVSIGIKRLLESDAFVLLGDLSLAAYTLQASTSKLFDWVFGPVGIMESREWIHLHWMEPWVFLIFAPTLYAISALVTYWVDRPVSKWIAGAVSDSTQHFKD